MAIFTHTSADRNTLSTAEEHGMQLSRETDVGCCWSPVQSRVKKYASLSEKQNQITLNCYKCVYGEKNSPSHLVEIPQLSELQYTYQKQIIIIIIIIIKLYI